MYYIWESGKPRRVMHIARFTPTGKNTMTAICRIGHRFDRSINAPFALGRRVCKNCQRLMGGSDEEASVGM